MNGTRDFVTIRSLDEHIWICFWEVRLGMDGSGGSLLVELCAR